MASTNLLTLVAVAAAALLCGVTHAQQVTTPHVLHSCYACSGTGARDTSHCGLMENKGAIPQQHGCSACFMSVTHPANRQGEVSGRSNYHRSCLTDGRVHPTTCVNNQTVGETHCWCSSHLCNDAPLHHLGTIDCYVCHSGDYVDNGCGTTVKPSSPFVRIDSNCVSCELRTEKAPAAVGGATRFVRSCINDPDLSVGCHGPNASYPWPCTTRCTTKLCNGIAAAHRNTVSALALALGAALGLVQRVSRLTYM